MTELATFNNVMEQAYDLFPQESFIRNIVNEIYFSVFDPMIEIEEICGYIGLLGVSINDENLSSSMLQSSKQNLEKSKFMNQDEDDWFMVERDAIYSIQDHEV